MATNPSTQASGSARKTSVGEVLEAIQSSAPNGSASKKAEAHDAKLAQDLSKLLHTGLAAAKAQARADLGRLIPALKDLIAEPQSFVAGIEAQVDVVFDEVQEELLAVLEDGLASQVAERVQSLRDRISSDARFAEIQKAAPVLGVDVDIGGRFTQLFNAVSRRIAASVQ